MRIPTFSGVIPALVSPFRPDLSVDEEALAGLAEQLLAVEGVTGLLVNGIAGEANVLSAEEQTAAVRVAAAVLGGRKPLIAGICADSPLEAARQAAAACENGADAVLVQAPPVFARGVAQVHEVAVRYFATVASAQVPLILFQHPARSAVSYPSSLLLRLLELDAVIGVKETIWDVERYQAEVRAIRERHPGKQVLCGNDTLLLASMVTGRPDALLIGVATLLTSHLVALYEAVLAGDIDGAVKINEDMAGVMDAIYGAPPIGYYPRLKAALHITGRIPTRHVRPPLLDLADDELEPLARVLRAAGLLTPA